VTSRDGNHDLGRQPSMRRLLAVRENPAPTVMSTGTQPLSGGIQPGEIAVAEAALRSIEYLGGNKAQWDVRVLFGNSRVMTVASVNSRSVASLDMQEVLTDSLKNLDSGKVALAKSSETGRITANLSLKKETVLTYLAPIFSNGSMCGLIVIGSRNPLETSTCDALRAIAAQSALLLEALQVAEGLRHSAAAFRALIQNASDIILIVHPNLTIIDLAPTASGMLEYHPDELLGMSIIDLIHPDDRNGAAESIQRQMSSSGTSAPVSWRLRRRDGSWIHVETIINNLLHDPGIGGIVLSARNVSERKALEESILHQVFHDELTGLPNRVAFMDLLDRALARRRNHSSSLAVLFIDLDRFKVVNDSLGHEAGNTLLVHVADRLRESVRGGDTVARLSGDEFVVLMDDIETEEPAIDVAERILYRLQQAIRIGSNEIFVSSSIGIAMDSSAAEDSGALSILRNADRAMYETKNRGRRGYTVFRPHMNAHAINRLQLETELRHAIGNSEFQIFYQPLIGLRSGQVDEVEALVRWTHPSRGLLLPDTFITLAEDTGLIEPIGQWVLEEACRQVYEWERERPGAPPLRLNVNLSVRQFQQSSLVRDVQRTLRSTNIDPHQLTLEITESVALNDAKAAVATMHELKKLGVRLAIDDFGTGYSALSYLKQFPVDALKVDRSFIEGLNYNHGDVAIVKAVIAFAKTMNLQVTAEGVETPDQLHQLRMLGCDLGQGYLFATPLPGIDLAMNSQYRARRLSLINPHEPSDITSSHRSA
jgi:diguanylate cyclase (GGDEF)-like protein/PAS domain S-box-containing protein